ncbi:MAG TPA: hypothetical protein DC084_36255, partial [Cupriavidus sp.]|nr:hypothetical protein [Cupriavidus sp.]
MPIRLSVPTVALAMLGTTGVALAVSPSFDCGNAKGQVEQLICKDDTLARLDRETTRLYGLALDARSLPAPQKKTLLAAQR